MQGFTHCSTVWEPGYGIHCIDRAAGVIIVVVQEQNHSRLFRYYPGDFGALTVKVVHMDLVFDVHDRYTRATSQMTVEVLEKPIKELALNACDLDIISVSCEGVPVKIMYDRARNILMLAFDSAIAPRTRLTLRTESICRPSDHVLEGLYYDRTPQGAPPTQITQCQQWGFQRIVPCIDDMTAKCTYTTTIIADERYTSILSNGDISIPRHPESPGRVSITYDNTVTPMAPYLFFLCVGTYDTHTRDFEYPDGHRFTLELLIPPGSDASVADYALQVLADAILWVYLFTGPGTYGHPEEKEKILALVRERDRLTQEKNQSPADLATIRSRLGELSRIITPGYQYTGTVYREIGMQNSDFGGMENVGNTTITMNRIMPYPQMTDPSFEYMVRVKVHEFYHNLNGSEVTGKTPFELWLNEAVTAFMENRYHAYLFGEDYSRLETVLGLYTPSTGTFALDAGSTSMPIEPDGFNDPNDLITGITYVKAAEFVRMIETMMGKEQFVRGLALYHTRYRHANATWQQWVSAMEEVSGQDFSGMARTWLKQTGFPGVTVSGQYNPDHRTYEMTVTQQVPENAAYWTFPFRAALVDGDGHDIAETLVRIEGPETKITFPDVDEPAFLSLNRGHTFYGKVFWDAGPSELYQQALHDKDMVNRFVALYRLAEQEIIRLIEEPGSLPSDAYLDLHFRILCNDDLSSEVGGLLLTLFDGVDSPAYAHRYGALYRARRTIEHSLASRHERALRDLYDRYNQRVPLTEPMDIQVRAIKKRQVKNTCLALLSTLDSPTVHSLIHAQITTGAVATDRLRAFFLYLNSTAPDRLEVMENVAKDAAGHPVSWEAYLAAIGGCSAPDAVTLIRQAEKSKYFDITQVNDHRALFGSFAANRKVSLQTSEGRALLKEFITRLAPVNQNSVVSLLRAFDTVDFMEEEYHEPLIDLLVSVQKSLDPSQQALVLHTIQRLLVGAPRAVKAWEALHGQVLGSA
ncbi:MAG: M1 family metallopeptidase [Methanolinea sp.]|jgi:aminopeptidase N|nr:M1 family metallopeptidase [Methanolinea sp.]